MHCIHIEMNIFSIHCMQVWIFYWRTVYSSPSWSYTHRNYMHIVDSIAHCALFSCFELTWEIMVFLICHKTKSEEVVLRQWMKIVRNQLIFEWLSQVKNFVCTKRSKRMNKKKKKSCMHASLYRLLTTQEYFIGCQIEKMKYSIWMRLDVCIYARHAIVMHFQNLPIQTVGIECSHVSLWNFNEKSKRKSNK